MNNRIALAAGHPRRQFALIGGLVVAIAFLLTAAATAQQPATAPPSGGISLTLLPVADAFVDSANPSANYGSASVLPVSWSYDGQRTRRALYRFDLSVIPAGAVIQQATLRVTRHSGSVGPASMVAARLTGDWAEGTVTWNNRPSAANPFASTSTGGEAGTATWDVTNIVAGWVAGTYANYGLAVHGPEGAPFERFLASREASGASLSITYFASAPSPTPTETVTAPPLVVGSGWNPGTIDGSLPPAPPAPSLDLTITGIEVTQNTQCFQSADPTCADNTVPLVLNKTLLVRVYVRVAAGTIPSAGLPNVPVRLNVWLSSTQVYTFTASVTAQTAPQRSNLSDTANFTLIVTGSGTGPFNLQATVNPNQALAETNYSNNQFPSGEFPYVFFTMYDVPPLQVIARSIGVLTPIGAYYYEPPDPRTFDFIRDTYPVPGVTLRIDPAPLPHIMGGYLLTDGDWSAMLNEVTNWRNSTSPRPANYHWYGLVPSVPASTNTGGMGWVPAASRGSLDWQAVGYNGNMFIAAHEVGHNLGRAHAPECISAGNSPDASWPMPNDNVGDVGWDPTGWDMRAAGSLVPATAKELMGYCGGFWVSGYTIKGLFARRQAVLSLPATPASNLPAATLQNYLVTAGAIYTDGTVVAEPFYQMAHPAGLSDDAGTGAYSLELQATGGAPIFTRYFDLHQPPCHHACDESHGFFAETVPYTTTAAHILIRQGATVLDTIDVSPNPPTVTVLSPNGGEQWGQSTAETVAWTGSDVDPNTTVSYNVLFSHDDGANWTAVATLITQTTLSLHATLFPGTEHGRFRVIATDGVNTAFDDSDAAFSIEHKPPEASITHPAPDQTFVVGVPVALTAYAYDLEDGDLGGSQVVWRSDGSAVGTGTSLIWSHVPPGRHTVTLTATDSEGNTSLATVSINITGAVFLPLLLR